MMFFLAKGFRVIAHDRRGHRRSTETGDGLDMDHYAHDLAALTEHPALQNAVHVGHSTRGGEVSRYLRNYLAGALAAVILGGAGVAGAGTETPIFNFPKANGGGQPMLNAQPVLDAKGRLYGTAGYGLSGTAKFGSVFELTPPKSGTVTWGRKLIYSFKGGVANSTDGYGPFDGVTIGAGGVLYGFTAFDGPAAGGSCGLAYQLTPPANGQKAWTYSVIYRFQATNPSDGCNPENEAPLIGSDGSLFGTTEFGGDANGDGTLFQLHPPASGQTTWTETVLNQFGVGNGEFGVNPIGSVVADSAGDLFGTTNGGGNHLLGTAWEYLTNGNFLKLHDFAGGSDGANPAAGLIGPLPGPVRSRTYYYGTALSGGGGSGCTGGCGTVFAVVMAGGSITEGTIHAFTGGSDGSSPITGLYYNGSLWGTTEFGGTGQCDGGCGTLFNVAVTKFGTFDYSLSDSFQIDGGDGNTPETGLTGDAAGNLYGMTQSGGKAGGAGGTVFEFVP